MPVPGERRALSFLLGRKRVVTSPTPQVAEGTLEATATTPKQLAPPPFPLPGGVMPSRTWEEELALRDASKPIEFAFTAEVEECVPGLKSIVEKALGGCPHNQKLLRSMGTRKE